jgi:hypothetical protein
MKESTKPFDPMLAMWLTLPGAAMCSVPIGIWLVPRILSGAGLSVVPGFSVGSALVLLLVPVAAITSKKAYEHCISTTGHPGIRMVLMVFNFIARGIAEVLVWLFIIGMILMFVLPIMKSAY